MGRIELVEGVHRTTLLDGRVITGFFGKVELWAAPEDPNGVLLGRYDNTLEDFAWVVLAFVNGS